MIGLIKKYYWLIVLITLLISMGQTLFMSPWQDDNALFFKLAHIEEPAGFLGSGIFGEKAYKYTAFFYYPIYLLFGHREFFYFAFGFLMYALSTYAVYKLVSTFLSREAGYLGGFLYAAGFVGSDSFIRLFNSVITSLSVMLVSAFIWCYWKFFKERKSWWYVLSVLIFFLAAEFARARTHYLIAVPVLFEVLFFWKSKTSKSILFSLMRIAPFLPIFYRYVIFEDYRSGGVINFVTSFLGGGYFQVFGFLSSLTNLVMPAWLTSFYFLFVLIVVYGLSVRRYTLPFIFLTIIWGVVSSRIFITPTLVVTQNQILMAFWGGELLLMALFAIFLIGKKHRPLYLFLLISILTSLIAYSFYSPLQVFEKINRYLSHSFFFLVIFFSLIFHLSRQFERKASLIITLLIIGWGISNLAGSFLYQRSIILTRTIPIRSFYAQFGNLMPRVEKGDVLYFDIADNARGNFANTFSVAQMPDSTAIAWRYSVDRYDFEMFSDTKEFVKALGAADTDKSRLHTFFYSQGVLTDSTSMFLSNMKEAGIVHEISIDPGETEFENLGVPSFIPNKVTITLQAFADLSLKDQKLSEYGEFKKLWKEVEVSVTSFWQDRVAANLNDGDNDSVWQPNRLSWLKGPQSVTFKVNKGVTFNRLAFINSNSDFTPTAFEIFSSDDNSNWKLIGSVQNDQRYVSGELRVFDFALQDAKYFKIVFEKTLNEDAPLISEIWLIPEKFGDLDIGTAEKFLEVNKLKLYWVNDKNSGWQTSSASSVELTFDGRARVYNLPLPAGGTTVSKLKFDINSPKRIRIYSLSLSPELP